MVRPTGRYGLSGQVEDIITHIDSKRYTVPYWFDKYVTWVRSGQITEQEFILMTGLVRGSPGLSESIIRIIRDINEGVVIVPSSFREKIDLVRSGTLKSPEFMKLYNNLIGVVVQPTPEPIIPTPEPITPTPEPIIPTPEPEPTVWYWVIKPSGIIERIKITETSKRKLIGQGYIFSLTKPEPTPEPIIPTPEPIEVLPPVFAEPDITITDNMVTQQVINFNIVNGRAVGSIKFTATNNFNSYYYGHNIFNIIQFKDPNGANILTHVKENRLNFTETERDEVIQYDEDMKGNTRATVESFVWSSATAPTAFSKMYSIEISEAEPPKPITSGFMGAGAIGALAGLILIGFIADHKRGK